mmetsp:Transcript_694/g.1617  ORF Transcript_694/g.1617 Transcript_694/m.1617 type:complete len:233 (+) Transcript_694:1908-2606(+)
MRLVGRGQGGQLELEHAQQIEPELGVRLLCAGLVQEDNSRDHTPKHGKAHGNAVVVVALDACAVQLTGGLAHNLQTILQLHHRYAALGQLFQHHSDTIALLHALVGDARDAGRAVSHRGKHRHGHEGVGHVAHVPLHRLQPPAGSADARARLGLLRVAPHGLQDGVKLGIALDRRGSQVQRRDGSARDGGHGKGVCRGRCIALHVIQRRVGVALHRHGVRVGRLVGVDGDAE